MEKSKTEKELVIDATNAPLGRLASFVAKQARRGKNIVVVNVEKAIIIGKPQNILEDYLRRFRLGRGARKGPLLSRTPVGICRRTIRGMISWKKAGGVQAFKRVRCYEGMPSEYEKSEKLNFPKKALNAITLTQLSKLFGK